jgi:hypothetical protein
MHLVILGAVVLFYLGVALAVARMCSINSRWEDLVDRIPGPRIPAPRVKSTRLVPDDAAFLEEEGHTAPQS